jgi:DNA-directed RNA polymerase specialized sigma24 family protein
LLLEVPTDCSPVPYVQLRAAIETLTPDQRRVYILVAREGLGIASASEAMQLPSCQVERLLAEALVALLYALDP